MQMTGVAGLNHPYRTQVLVNGAHLGWQLQHMSWWVTILNMTDKGCTIGYQKQFYPYQSDAKTQEMADTIASFPDGTVFGGTIEDTYVSMTNTRKNILAAEFGKL